MTRTAHRAGGAVAAAGAFAFPTVAHRAKDDRKDDQGQPEADENICKVLGQPGYHG